MQSLVAKHYFSCCKAFSCYPELDARFLQSGANAKLAFVISKILLLCI